MSKKRREDNLIPFTEMSKEEHRRLSKKGARKSIEVRRKKANIRNTITTLLEMDLPKSKLRKQLEDMGIDPSMEQGLVLSVMTTAISKGDHKALETLVKMASDNDRLQQARIKKLEAETEKLKKEIALKDGTSGQEQAQAQVAAIADLINTAETERTLSNFLGDEDEE